MFLQEILASHARSISVIGMGKNTGKTFALNQLIREADFLGIAVALTSMGLDGEERDSLFKHAKPSIVVAPGQIVANAKTLLLESRLDYEILGTTGVMTPLGEIVLARSLNSGKTMLAGPGTRHELVRVKEHLERLGIDLLLVDGAIDRRSLAAPLVTDTTVFAVGAEASWDRSILLERLGHQFKILTLPALDNWEITKFLRSSPDELKFALFSETGFQRQISTNDFFQNDRILTEQIDGCTQTIYIRGMLTDDLLNKLLAASVPVCPRTIVVADATHVFLGKRGMQRLLSHGAELKVLEPIHISAVTVNPFNSSYGFVDPLPLLEDVGQAVWPVPCFDVRLGIRYGLEKEDYDAIP